MALALIVLVLIVVINCWFMFYLISDVTARKRAENEPGNSLWIGVISFFQFLLSTFGISDFAIGAAVYSKLKWVSSKKLPGTLNSAAVIPVAFMALIYITSIEIELLTLIVPIAAQAVGAYISPRFVVKMRIWPIRVFLALGMFVTVLRMAGEAIGFFPAGGTATELSAGGLVLLGGLCLLYGVLNNLGLGSYAPTMATVYALGLNPIAAFPIMMGAAAFSVPTASIQFIRHDSYSRKITIVSAIFGTLGVFAAAFLIKDMDITVFKWLIALFLLYSACSMLRSALKDTEDSEAAPNIETKENRLSFVGRLTSLCVVLILLCAVLLISVCVKNFQTISYDYTEISINTHNAHLIDNVEAYLRERENLLLSARVGAAHFMSQKPVDLEQLRLYFENTSRVLDDVSTLYCTTNDVWNKSGGYAVFSQPWDVPQDWDNTGRLWFLAAKKAQGKIAYSRPYIDALTGDIIMDMSCNIYDKNGNDIGVISMAITIETINNTLLNSANLVEDQQIYLIDSRGVFVVHPDKEMVAKRNFINDAGLEHYREDILHTDKFNVVNNDIMILSSPIANTGWFMVSMTPIKKIFTPINDNIISMFMSPLLIIFFMLLIVLISLSVIVRGESKAKLAAERITMEKTNFIARVSHEIRTPMNAVMGMSEIILRKNLPQDVYENAIGIKTASTNLLSIINDILDISKIESGMMEIIETEYMLPSLINDVVGIIRIRLIDKPVQFVVDIAPNIPSTLIGDEVRMRQILINLLSNAVKYTNEGYISLSVSGDIGAGNTVKFIISVTDSGIGIREEDKGKLFGDFVQIDTVKNKGIVGTGLGLAISRHLARLMGGDITLESEYGKGSTFTVTVTQRFGIYEPFAAVKSDGGISVLLYETRQIYKDSLISAFEGLGVEYESIEDMPALFEKLEKYNYVFTSSFLYESINPALTELDNPPKLVLLSDITESFAPKDARTLALPAYSLSVANILDNVYNDYSTSHVIGASFIAPEAKVLIVDDVTANLKVCEGLLLPYEMQVTLCLSGSKALELVATKEYDLVFMDHMMPEMDGLEVTSRIRAMEGEYFKSLPVIALTANAVSGVREMFIQSGMNDFLSKPIETKKLDVILGKWIPKEKHKKITGPEQPEEESDFVNMLRAVPELSVDKALSIVGGSSKTYERTVKLSVRLLPENIAKLENLIETSLTNYSIEVHGIKGVLNNIGAYALGAKAFELEELSKKGDIDACGALHPGFIAELTAFSDAMQDLLKEPAISEKPAGDISLLMEVLPQLEEAADFCDNSSALKILESVNKYTYGEAIDKTVSELSSAFERFEFDEALELLDKLKED